MAYDDSGPIEPGESYTLGAYTFSLQNVVSEDERILQAHISGPEGTAAKGITVPTGAQLESWYVEANETEASVYAHIHTNAVQIDTGNIQQPIPTSSSILVSYGINYGIKPWYTDAYSGNAAFWGSCEITGESGRSNFSIYAASPEPTSIDEIITNHVTGDDYHYTIDLSRTFTYNGKTVYYWYVPGWNPLQPIFEASGVVSPYIRPDKPGELAWAMVYSSEEKDEEILVARFAIDIREADTESWDEPGDDGPPGTTLYVTVTGASAGSCTGVPTTPEKEKNYGSGGTGGNGGGGGAGASTVIIYEFATDKAETVVQEAISRGPGNGGPGGKGGDGADGCIMILY